jgi:hypothetical protein
MADEIRQAEVLTDEEKQLLFGWGENIFGVAALKLSWRPKDLHFLLYADGEPVSHVGVLKHAVSVNGEPATVGGVGGGRYCTGGAEERISSPPHAAYGGIL